MKDKILKFFSPSWKKIITMVVLAALTAGTVYLLIGVAFGGMMSLGYDTLSLEVFIANLLGLVFVAFPYFVFMAWQTAFGELDLPTSVVFAIMIAIELAYLYFLSCVVVAILGKFTGKRKSKPVKISKSRHCWPKPRTDVMLLASFAVILLFDGLALPRRLDYLLQFIDGAAFIIEKFSTAFKIMVLSIFEIWYLVFLFLRRNKLTWNKLVLIGIWLVVFILLALNIMMLLLAF